MVIQNLSPFDTYHHVIEEPVDETKAIAETKSSEGNKTENKTQKKKKSAPKPPKKYKQQYNSSLIFTLDLKEHSYFSGLLEAESKKGSTLLPTQAEYYTAFQYLTSKNSKFFALGTVSGEIMYILEQQAVTLSFSAI